MSVEIPIQYDNVFGFLEDYRAHISELRYTVPTPEPLVTGQDVTVVFRVPLIGEQIAVEGRVMAPLGDRAGLQLVAEGSDGMERLEDFYRYMGRVVEQMLLSGRFKVAGQWPEGVQGTMEAGGVRASDPAAPLSARVTRGAPTLEGSVTEETLTELFMKLYSQRATGVLEIRSGQGRRLAWFKSGGVVQWENDPVVEEECLGVLLTRAGKLTEDQLRTSLEMMRDTGQKQGACFVEMGVLTFPKLIMSLATQVEIITRKVFALTSGTYSFSPVERLPTDVITPPLKTPGFLFGVFKRRFAAMRPEELQGLLQGQLDRYTVFAQDVNWDDMRMKKDELGLVRILSEKSYRFRSVFSVSNMGRAKTIPIVLALAEMDILSFVDAEDKEQVQDRWARELEAKVNFQRSQNPFEVLEVHWTSQSTQIEAAYKKMKATYERYARGATLPSELDAMRLTILENIEAAYDLVRDKPTRQKTRRKHYEKQQLENSADLLTKQGEMLMVRGKWAEVIDNLERSLELAPNSSKTVQLLDKARKRSQGYGSITSEVDL